MLKIGIVGLPNVGKSTLFNALLGSNLAAASNFPFCTIEPNTGIVPVPDPRLDQIAAIEKSAKIIPATVEFVDIAGLVKGASQGQGLGNKFLSHIREVDAIIHVVRLFEDKNITHVHGSLNPIEDIATINLELILADLDVATKLLDTHTKAARGQNKEAQAMVDLLSKIKPALEAEQPVRSLAFTFDEAKLLRSFQFLTAKPILYVANLQESQVGNSELTENLQAQLDGSLVLGISAQIESEIAALPPADQQTYLADIGLSEPGLHRLIRAGYQLLGLISFLTAGPQESRAWTIPAGTLAPDAAGAIHTDFAKGFIRAETVSTSDFIAHQGWVGAREAGKVRSEGKTYVVQDGDVMLFRFNV